MSDYKNIYREEDVDIPWESDCPVMLTAARISEKVETVETWLQTVARNVSGGYIS